MEKYIKDESPIGRVCDSITPIYQYHHRDTGQAVVVKSLLLQPKGEEDVKEEDALADTKEYGIPWRTIREMALVTATDHDNIARLLEIDYEDGDSLVHLVFEYAGMDLQKFMQEHPDANNQRIIKNLLLQLLRGISYLHSMGVAHGGLNTKNVLVDITSQTLKILNLYMDTPAFYEAPELLLSSNEPFSPAMDLFSIGCIFAEIVNRAPLWDRKGDFLIEDIFSVLGNEQSEHQLKQKLADMLPSLEEKLLCLDPSKRIDASSAMKHAYFRDIA